MPVTSCCQNQLELLSEKSKGLLETKVLLLKGLCTDSLAHNLAHSELHQRGSSLKTARDTWGRPKWTTLKARAAGVGAGAALQ